MKKILTLCTFALICALGHAQETYNFSTKDGDVIWQKVYPTTLNKRAVFDAIKTNGSLSDITETDQTLTGNLVERAAEYSSLGFSRGDVPIFVHHLLGGFVKVEIRDGRYRVTVSKMYRIDDTTPKRERTDFTFYVKKNGEFRFFPETARFIFDANFNKMFEIKDVEEDW
jgi:hypothetical protein